jgi:hypothetical protein
MSTCVLKSEQSAFTESSFSRRHRTMIANEEDQSSLLHTDGPPCLSSDVATAVPLDVVAVEAVEVQTHDEPTKPVTYQDVPFAVAFLVHLVFVLGVALFAGIPALSVTAQNTTASTSAAVNPYSSGHGASLLSPIAVAIVTALPISFLALYSIQKYAMAAIKCMMVVVVALKVVLAIWFFASGLIFVGAMILLFAALAVCFFYLARNRMEFAAAHLEIACDAVRANPTTVYVAFGTQVVQLLWMLVWCLGLYGIVAGYPPSSNTGTFVATSLWMFFLYWACYSAQNVAHCTTSGAVGSWWFTNSPTNTVQRSLGRALTTSFGSIALGSLIVALIQTARFMLHSLERATKKHNFVVCCIRCILNIVEGWVRYFNKYAFVVVALYGNTFRSSGGEVWSLFRTRGWTAIINDDLVEMVMSVTCLGIGAVTAFVGGLVAFGQSGGSLSSVYVPVLVAFLIGLFLASTVLGVLDSAVKTCFFCYAKAPLALHATHPSHFYRITEAWNLFAPMVHESSGYKNMAMTYAEGAQEVHVVNANQVVGDGDGDGGEKWKEKDVDDPLDSV